MMRPPEITQKQLHERASFTRLRYAVSRDNPGNPRLPVGQGSKEPEPAQGQPLLVLGVSSATRHLVFLEFGSPTVGARLYRS